MKNAMYMQRRGTYRFSQAGFTLVEMLVSIALFTVVLAMSVGTLLILIDANAKAQSMQLVMTNLTFALDSMTREIRTGYNWYCTSPAGEPTVPSSSATQDCAAGSSISIMEGIERLTDGQATNRIAYWFDDNTNQIMRKVGTDTSVPLTGPDIRVDEMRIVVNDTDQLDASTPNMTQPSATIYIRGVAGAQGSETSGSRVEEFEVQTTVTQRVLDI